MRMIGGLALALLFSLDGASAEPRRSLNDGLVRYAMHDYVQAQEILLPLARDGNADAQVLLGRMHAHGEGVAADAREAARWYEQAAAQGRTEAQIALGTMYADGDGIEADEALALHWLRRAAEQNMPDAMNAVGELLLRSSSPQMRAEARIWFLRAARLDNARALYHLGQIHAFGSGVRQDDTEAYKWFDLAASAGPGPERDVATRALMTLRERMTPMQVAWATRSAEFWFRAHIVAVSDATIPELEAER